MKTRPIFEDDEKNEFDQRVRKIVEDKVTEKYEIDKQKSAKDKLDKIRESLNKDLSQEKSEKIIDKEKIVEKHVHEECPTCKGHSLHVKDDIAMCTGPGCGKEFLLVEKIKDVSDANKKKYLCSTCGYSVGPNEIEKIKKADTCPSCNKGKSFYNIDWKNVNKDISSGGFRKI